MIAPRGPNIVELDMRASAPELPYGIVTADCSDPKEIDDGVFVEPLPAAQETYRVGVCVADTSKLYDDREVFNQAMTRTEAKYFQLPGKEVGYEPMIDPELIRDLEFSQGNVRSALIIRFLVGANQPPSDVEVMFGKVEVARNHDYKEFGYRCRNQEEYEKYGRASAFILRHLRYTSGGDNEPMVDTSADVDSVHKQLVNMPAHQAWLRGSRLNEAFMVGANHLVGRLLAEEGRPAIYRVHDPEDERYLEFIPPTIATYSRNPGKHVGLNLDSYCRVTSPLRRLEDFYMSDQLRKRHKGEPVTRRDEREAAAVVQTLNRRVAYEVSQGPLRLTDQDVLGKNWRPGGLVPGLHAVSAESRVA
jgi:exoribonuclease II